MVKRSVFALAFGASVLVGGLAHGDGTSLVGVVTRVEGHRLELRTERQEILSLTLGSQTTYRKWLLAKPWQQGLLTDLRSVRVGRRVHVELAPGAPQAAHTVWVVTGRPGLD